MGFLKSLKKSVVGKALDTLTVALAHPVKTATAIVSKKTTVKGVIKEHFAQPLSKQITQTVVGTASIAATIAGGAAVGAFGKAAQAGKVATIARTAALGGAKAVSKTAAANPIKTAIGVPVATGLLIKSPSTRKAAATILSPSANVERGMKAAAIIEGTGTSGSKVLGAAKVAGLIGAGAAAAVVLPKVVSAVKDKIVKIKAPGQAEVVFTPEAAAMPKATTPVQTTPGEIKPQVAPAAKNGTPPIKVSQKVNVSVRNSKRYINAIAVSN